MILGPKILAVQWTNSIFKIFIKLVIFHFILFFVKTMMNKVLTSYLKPTMILIDDAFNLKIKVLFRFFFIVKTKKKKIDNNLY